MMYGRDSRGGVSFPGPRLVFPILVHPRCAARSARLRRYRSRSRAPASGIRRLQTHQSGVMVPEVDPPPLGVVHPYGGVRIVLSTSSICVVADLSSRIIGRRSDIPACPSARSSVRIDVDFRCHQSRPGGRLAPWLPRQRPVLSAILQARPDPFVFRLLLLARFRLPLADDFLARHADALVHPCSFHVFGSSRSAPALRLLDQVAALRGPCRPGLIIDVLVDQPSSSFRMASSRFRIMIAELSALLRTSPLSPRQYDWYPLLEFQQVCVGFPVADREAGSASWSCCILFLAPSTGSVVPVLSRR